jgi:hypothetical protein
LKKVKIEQFNSFGENQKVFVNVGGEWRKTTRLWGAIDWIKMTRFRHNQHHNFGESNSFFWLIKFLELRSTKRHNQHHNFGSSNCFFGSSNLWDYNQQEGKYFSDNFFRWSDLNIVKLCKIKWKIVKSIFFLIYFKSIISLLLKK